MDIELRSYEYFSHKIIDCGEKVQVTNLSEKFEQNLEECSSILSKWIESRTDLNLQKEYIVSGLKPDGTALITVVSEAKLKQAENQLKGFQKTLFSAQISTSSFFDLYNLTQVKYKQKKLNSITSRLGNEVSQHTSPKKDYNIASTCSKTPEKNVDKDIVHTNNLSSKDNKKSPKLKKGISPKNGKGAISSFFSARPLNSKLETKVKSEYESHSVATSKSEEIVVKSENDNKSSSYDEENDIILPKDKFNNSFNKYKNSVNERTNTVKKRPLSDDSSNDRKNVKNVAKRAKSSAGRKRIIVDTSDEENVDTDREKDEDDVVEHRIVKNNPLTEVGAKLEVEDMDAEVEYKNSNTDDKTMGSITYQDEDGFLITIKEKKPLAKAEKAKPEKKSLTKADQVVVKTATKQGSIMNFFSKK